MEEATWLASATDGTLAAEEWAELCGALGEGVVDEKINKDHLWKMYDEMGAGDVEVDYPKVVAASEAPPPAEVEEAEQPVENPLRVKCDAMFDLVDRDGDGLINLEEATWLAAATGRAIDAGEWAQLCEALGESVVGEKVGKDDFWRMYNEMGAGDVEEDYPKVVAASESE